MVKNIHYSQWIVSNILVRIWKIFHWKFERYTKNALDQSIFEHEKCFFFKWVRISPEIDWYHYQGASLEPTCIVRHQTITKTLWVKCHIRAQCVGGVKLKSFLWEPSGPPHANFLERVWDHEIRIMKIHYRDWEKVDNDFFNKARPRWDWLFFYVRDETEARPNSKFLSRQRVSVSFLTRPMREPTFNEKKWLYYKFGLILLETTHTRPTRLSKIEANKMRPGQDCPKIFHLRQVPKFCTRPRRDQES